MKKVLRYIWNHWLFWIVCIVANIYSLTKGLREESILNVVFFGICAVCSIIALMIVVEKDE